MNLEQLEAIKSVAEKGGFRAAAEFLNRSQPAISASIKSLEEEFQLQIFDRKGYRAKLTVQGAAFLEVATATLKSANFASRVAHELGKMKTESEIHVSVDPLASNKFISIMVEECNKPLLPVTLILENSLLKGSCQDILSGRIDFAIAPASSDSDEIEQIPLQPVTLVGGISKKGLGTKKHATKEMLLKCPQILAYDKNFDEKPDDLLPNPIHKGSNRRIFVPDHFTKLRLIKAGLGWGRISETELKENKDLTQIGNQYFEAVRFKLCLIRAKARPLGPVGQEIWRKFLKTFSQPGGAL